MIIDAAVSRQFALVAQALAFIDARGPRAPTFDEIAAAVALSEQALERVLADWADISSARFLHYLSKDYRRQQLAASSDLLTASTGADRNSSGRAGERMLSWESMTADQIKATTRDIGIGYGFGPIFAELKDVPVGVGTGPGAGLTVETVQLVDLEQRPGARHDASQAQRVACRLDHRSQTRGRGGRSPECRRRGFRWGLSGRRRHAGNMDRQQTSLGFDNTQGLRSDLHLLFSRTGNSPSGPPVRPCPRGACPASS